jgi:RNA polymerase sigma-70 factor (ECF subfamily)
MQVRPMRGGMSNRLQEGPSAAGLPMRFASGSELLLCAKQGDHAAYLELCQRASPMAMSMIIKITKNHDDAEDAMQEALINAFLHLHSFNEQSTFSTWFVRIAVNASLMLLRKQRRFSDVRRSSEDGDDIFDNLVDPSPSAETILCQREKRVRLRQAIEGLPSTLRRTVELRHAEGASVQQVAAHMGISVPAVKSRLARATVKLRLSLGESALAAGQHKKTPRGASGQGLGSVIGDRTRTLRLERAAC